MSNGSFLSRLLGGGKAPAQKDTEVLRSMPDTLTATASIHIYQRNVYHVLLRVALVESVVAFALILAAIWIVISAKPQDRFFVSSVDGRIDRVVPLDVPLMDSNEIYSRAATNIAEAMTFGYLDYDQRRIEISEPFSPEALKALQDTLIGEGGMARLTQEARIYQAEVDPTRGGGISRQGINQDFIYEWLMQAPVNVSVQSSLQGNKLVIPYTATFVVQRARQIEKISGYVIVRILGLEANGPPQPVAADPAQPATPGATP